MAGALQYAAAGIEPQPRKLVHGAGGLGLFQSCLRVFHPNHRISAIRRGEYAS